MIPSQPKNIIENGHLTRQNTHKFSDNINRKVQVAHQPLVFEFSRMLQYVRGDEHGIDLRHNTV